MTNRGETLTSSLRDSRLSVIVPVFNEVEHVIKNIELLISEVEPHFSSFEILVVSDGSTDGTNQVLAAYRHDRVSTVLFEKNQGKGAVVREGFRRAQGDYIFFIDGGMELHPRELRIFLGLMSLYDADMVLGSKRHPQSQIDYPMIRRVLSSVYQLLIQRLFDLDVTDTQVGIKLFRREVIDAVLPDLRIDRYGFDLEILALAKLRGFDSMLEAPIRLDYFVGNRRPLIPELFHIFRVGMDILGDTWRLYWRVRSLRGR